MALALTTNGCYTRRMKPLRRMAKIYGSRARFAAAMGVSGEAVRKWERTRVPAERCREIERLSHGEITVHQLRPDLFGPAPTTADAA